VYTIFALGYERRISITTLVEGLVNLAAALILVRWLGPIGAPLGSILGVCLVSIPGNLSALAHELHMSTLRTVAPLWSWFWRLLLVAGCAGVIGQHWHPSLPYVIGVTCVTGTLYVVVMLPMIMDSPMKGYLPPQAIQVWESFLRRLHWSPVAAAAQPVEAPKNS